MLETYESDYITKITDLTVNGKLYWYETKNDNISRSYRSDVCKYTEKVMKFINSNKELLNIEKEVVFTITRSHVIIDDSTSYSLHSIYYKDDSNEVEFNIDSLNEKTIEYKMLKRLFDVVEKYIENRDNNLKINNIYSFLNNFNK